MRVGTRAATLLTGLMIILVAWPASPPAQAAPAARSASAGLTVAAQSQQDGVRIELDSISPRLVTSTGPGVLTVTGRVFNGGDRTISGLDVRVQRGEAVRNDAELRAALAGSAPTDSARPRFTEITGGLPPDGTVTFQVTVPLRGGGELDSLNINAAGVYPLLVNLNGTPEFGSRARLAAVRLLLPVLSLPAVGDLPAVPAVAPAVRTPVTIVWPLVDRPRRLPNAPGEPAVLTDDDLAESLGPGGRLRGLLDAAAQVAPAGSSLAPALCFAIDPELVDTVSVMAQGPYLLADGRSGAGSRAATEWLQLLANQVEGRCVLALPFADVDQVALSRAGLTDLQGRALADGAQILADRLGVRPAGKLSWPAGELLDERTLTDLASLGHTAVLLDPAGLTDAAAAAGSPTVGLTTGSPATAGLRAVLVDPLVDDALAGSGAAAAAGPAPLPGQGNVVATTIPAGTDGPLASHDGSAALVGRIMGGGAATSGVLIAPPRRWQTSATEAAELLRTAGELMTGGFAQARDLGRLTATPPAVTTTIQYPVRAGADEVPRAVTANVTTTRDQLRDMDDATDRDPRANVDPASLFDPIRYGLLRATSSAWRQGEPAPGNGANVFAADAGLRLSALRETVRIEPPAGPYLLAASNAPLLITLDNPLAVQIDVQITLSEVPGLRTGSIDVVQVPAASRRQVRIPTEVIRAGQFSVEAQLSTPGGTPLGPTMPSRIQLRSTAYGTVTLALTGGGAVLLVLLAGYRITRRVRGAGKRAAAGDAS